MKKPRYSIADTVTDAAPVAKEWEDWAQQLENELNDAQSKISELEEKIEQLERSQG